MLDPFSTPHCQLTYRVMRIRGSASKLLGSASAVAACFNPSPTPTASAASAEHGDEFSLCELNRSPWDVMDINICNFFTHPKVRSINHHSITLYFRLFFFFFFLARSQCLFQDLGWVELSLAVSQLSSLSFLLLAAASQFRVI